MTFRVGQKVVCIDGSINPNGYNENYPAEGGIYTIRGFHLEPHINDCGILLEEIVNTPVDWADAPPCEWPFASKRFRPIVERKTSIEIFTRMLLPQGVEA